MQELINKTKSKGNIRLLGHLEREFVLSILSEYSGAIHPSLWPEVCPLTVIEFLCAGLPIVTLESNTSAVTIVDNNCGIVLEKFTNDGLKLALESVDKNFETLSHNARSSYLKFFTLNAWLITINLFIDEVVRVPKEIKG
jgi:glycosyltransferase involved in cell wall biosynthesis